VSLGEHATNSPEINGVRAAPASNDPVFLIKSRRDEILMMEFVFIKDSELMEYGNVGEYGIGDKGGIGHKGVGADIRFYIAIRGLSIYRNFVSAE
jgi:hypothetical protein